MDDKWWSAMTSTDTPNAGRCWWGWGLVSEVKKVVVGIPTVLPLTVDEAALRLRPPRIPLDSLPTDLRSMCLDHAFERLLHSRGRDFVDILENLHGVPDAPTDLVAFPRREEDISELLKFCSAQDIAVIPFGGGSSVVFGVNPPDDAEGYRGTISVDMLYFDQILEVDKVSMCARVQGGIYGPRLEKQLKSFGLTLRHFPQSFEFSTLGGWIVTRGGGHFATGPTHIDELVQSVRLVTPAGITETRRLPASGAGPAENRLYIGSEGSLGIVTEAWVRLRPIPIVRASATFLFRAKSDDEAFILGASAVRQVSQSGLQPANLRLVYGEEVARLAQEDGLAATAVLLLGFEGSGDSGEHIEAQMRKAVQFCLECGGEIQGVDARGRFVRSGGTGDRGNLAGRWGSGFMKGGYTFSAAAAAGFLLNTFETAVTWDRFFNGFHTAVLEATRNSIKKHCSSGTVTCRFTHVYPDGPAPYYTILAAGSSQPEDKRVQQWQGIKAAAMEAVMKHGGTSTHHHAVGKLHRGHYHTELGGLFKGTLEVVKQAHDPAWVMNPGVLLDIRRPQRSRL